MNLLLFDAEEVEKGVLAVSDRRHHHLRETLKIEVGSKINVGQIDGLLGVGEVLATQESATHLAVSLTTAPPPPLPLKLILALPRPKMLRRILQAATSLGVKDIHLVNSYRVEKSFWQSPWLKKDAIRQQLLLGLEQCLDTELPKVYPHPRFKPFVEDLLPDVVAGALALVAHPYAAKACPSAIAEPVVLAVGPEGGFIPYEINKLVSCGFQSISLGPRILRVETAIPALISRLCH